jgi:SAM-dependent methyltransferase
MTEVVFACPLCGNQQNTLFDQRQFHGHLIANRLCSNCGLVFLSPRMTRKELEAFYEGEYRQLYQGDQGPNPKDLTVQGGRAEALLKFARPHLPRVSRHLDIGCSSGLLLQCFQQAYGCRPVGIEPGVAYRRFTQEKGLVVYSTLSDLRQAGEARFDLISMAHVLEHLPNPVNYLSALRQDLLTLDGRLLIEVPNLYAHDSFEVAHLVSYSPHTMSETLRQAGFEVVSLHTHGRPRSSLLPLYITALACTATTLEQRPMRAESQVKLKRQVGLLHRDLLSRFFPGHAWLPLDKAE